VHPCNFCLTWGRRIKLRIDWNLDSIQQSTAVLRKPVSLTTEEGIPQAIHNERRHECIHQEGNLPFLKSQSVQAVLAGVAVRDPSGEVGAILFGGSRLGA
jgi:hypothetical protein